MVPYEKRMYLHILVISSICLNFILTCDVHVCLTWEAEKGNITFKCKVSRLRFQVHFLNPANDDLGFCVSPVPVPGCYSRDNVISQDLETNTSVLVIQRHIDDRLNGPWKCRHGTNVDAAIVNVTVIHQVTFKTVFVNDNCGEQHMAWTFIGVMLGVFIALILTAVIKTSTREKWRKSCCMCSKRCCYATRAFISILLIALVLLIPYVSGIHRNSCKDKGFFILFGVIMVFMFVLGLCIRRKGKQKEQSSDFEMTSNQHLLSDENTHRTDSETARNQSSISEENEQSTDSQTSRNLRSKKNLVAEKNKSEEKE